MNKQFLTLAIVASLTLFSGCTKPKTNDLKIGISQEFENMNPLIASMSATNYMYRMVGRYLVTLNPEGKWVPQLAKEIPSIENKTAEIVTINGKKTVVAHWEILENAKWSDGVPVTCADFDFATKVAASPNVAIAEKETYTQVQKIEWDEKNPKKCKFTYDKARWDFYQLGTFAPLPKHIEEPVYNQHKDEKEGYEKNSNYVKNPTMPGLYNGPFVIKEIKLGSHVAFTTNPHFYGNAASIKNVVVKVIPNTGTMEANLRSGTINMISTIGISLDQALELEKKVKAENLPFVVSYVPSLTYEHIDLNLDNPILKDVRVRKALVHAINRDDLVNSLFEGKQQAALHNVSPKDSWFTNDPKVITIYNYSKETANKLLDQAGWKMGPDNYRYKDGKKLSLTIMTTAGNKNRETVQVYLQEQWKQIGIELLIKNEPARVFFGETTKKRKFEAMAMFAWVSSPESTPRSNFHSKSIPTEKNGWSGQNNPGWVNPKVDKLIDQLDVEFDAEKRKKLSWEIQKIYTEEVPVIPMFYRADISVNPTNLKNFRAAGHQFSETNEIENWVIEN